MVAIPQFSDPTLDAADRALEEQAAREAYARPYLGMSAIGNPCERALWYGFRWAVQERHDAATLKRFADGHYGEDLQAERLRMVLGLSLLTIDPETGRQWGLSDHGGHFRGHMDGAIVGLLQAPTKWHVWEHKQVGEKKLAALRKAKADLGEKAALAAWDEIYHAQAQCYMHYTGMDRHYLTVSSPGGRATESCRTEYDAQAALRMVARAERIIFSDNPPERISSDPTFFRCKWCAHAEHCHSEAAPARSCRTCVFATPEPAGGWSCTKHETALDTDRQRLGCGDQRLIPSTLAPWRQTDAADDAAWIAYGTPAGRTWVDEGPAHA